MAWPAPSPTCYNETLWQLRAGPGAGLIQQISKNKQKREIMNIFFSFRVWRLLLSFNASFNTDND